MAPIGDKPCGSRARIQAKARCRASRAAEVILELPRAPQGRAAPVFMDLAGCVSKYGRCTAVGGGRSAKRVAMMIQVIPDS
jgi:hypothetical protein